MSVKVWGQHLGGEVRRWSPGLPRQSTCSIKCCRIRTAFGATFNFHHLLFTSFCSAFLLVSHMKFPSKKKKKKEIPHPAFFLQKKAEPFVPMQGRKTQGAEPLEGPRPWGLSWKVGKLSKGEKSNLGRGLASWSLYCG